MPRGASRASFRAFARGVLPLYHVTNELMKCWHAKRAYEEGGAHKVGRTVDLVHTGQVHILEVLVSGCNHAPSLIWRNILKLTVEVAMIFEDELRRRLLCMIW